MRNVQLFAVTSTGPLALDVPASAKHVHDLFDDLPVGVYTALATIEHNKFLLLADHLDRLEKSMWLLGWDYRLDRQALRTALHETVTAYPLSNARVRLDVLEKPVPGIISESRLLIGLSPFVSPPESIYQNGVVTGTIRNLVREDPLVKMAKFVFERRKCLEVYSEVYECLLVDAEGYILEGTTSNFYAMKDGMLWTAGQGVLEGVARKIVLKVAQAEKLPINYSPIHVGDLDDLDEAALSSSSRAIVPIVKIDDQQIGSGRPGPIMTELLADYQRAVSRLIRPAINDHNEN
jgi:branched-chain amino acid aminotransferase